jgi:hypothetical protein
MRVVFFSKESFSGGFTGKEFAALLTGVFFFIVYNLINDCKKEHKKIRPAACRNHISIATPIECDEESMPGHKVPSPNQLDIAVIMSAMMQYNTMIPLAHGVEYETAIQD